MLDESIFEDAAKVILIALKYAKCDDSGELKYCEIRRFPPRSISNDGIIFDALSCKFYYEYTCYELSFHKYVGYVKHEKICYNEIAETDALEYVKNKLKELCNKDIHYVIECPRDYIELKYKRKAASWIL